MWKVPLTLLYICLPIFSSKKVLWKVPPGFVSQSCLFFWGPWGKFCWPRKRFSGFCGRFPQLFFTFVSQFSLRKRFCGRFPQLFFAFVSQSFLVVWKVPLTLLYICLPIFSSKKVLWKVPPSFSPTALALGSSAIVKGFFAANGFRLPKASAFVSQSPAVFWANGCCFGKGSVEGSANYSLLHLHLSPKLLYKSSLEGSASCALHLCPSVLLGSKLRELFTRLTHTNPVRRKQPIMSLLLGYSLGLLQKKYKKASISIPKRHKHISKARISYVKNTKYNKQVEN